MITVSVVYALPDAATEIALELSPPARVGDALRESRIGERHPEIDVACCDVGIFGKRVGRDALLADGDRIEIYRALQADPKAARRARARRQRA